VASRQTIYYQDPPDLSVMSSPGTAPEASAQWFAGAFPVESMLLPRQACRPFGLDRDEPGPEDLA
jgi:hypothetical protein